MGSELAKTTQDGYRKQTARCLSAMLETLESYGKKACPALFDGWGMALTARSFPFELIEPTCAWFCTHASKFPTPAEFMDRGFEILAQSESDDRVAATMDQVKAENAAYRMELMAKGIDPDELVSLKGLGGRILALEEKVLD